MSSDDTTPEHSPELTPATSRRGFLKASGLGLAGLVVGGAAGAAAGAAIGHSIGYSEGQDDLGALTPRQVAGFEHIVVLMGENRSFDNMLGWLYTAETLPQGANRQGTRVRGSDRCRDGQAQPGSR